MTMRTTIRVKFLAATNTKGARMRAICKAKSIYVNRADNLNDNKNAIMAARKLAVQMNWAGWWIGGWYSNNEIVFVNCEHDGSFLIYNHEVKP